MKTNEKWQAWVYQPLDGDAYCARAWKRTGASSWAKSKIATHDCKTEAQARRALRKLAKEFGIKLEWEK